VHAATDSANQRGARAGHATVAALAGVKERDIMRQPGHRSAAMLRCHIRDGSLFRSTSAAAVGS
jgi:hypothetical protein